ncbi:MAG: 4Fe-4S dicluster domain-containing protein, partial [Bacteroidales bacterium]|nr:4Fe-4S dicluster domain-containing protein [Bacteroidales bacterium]
PTGVLQPSLNEYGWLNVMQPVMDPHTGYCNYECVRCLEVCPTGAITRLSPEEKKKVQIGRTRFIEELCVVTKDNTACGACSEHCPTKAVNMIPWKGGKLTIPNVDNTICVGCGACEFACPTTPRSIVVDGNPIHRIAEMPRNMGEKAEEAVMEEFPF